MITHVVRLGFRDQEGDVLCIGRRSGNLLYNLRRYLFVKTGKSRANTTTPYIQVLAYLIYSTGILRYAFVIELLDGVRTLSRDLGLGYLIDL